MCRNQGLEKLKRYRSLNFFYIALEQGANLGHIKQSHLKIQNVTFIGEVVFSTKCKSACFSEHTKNSVKDKFWKQKRH